MLRYLILLLVAFGCQTSSKKSVQEISINVIDEPPSLDPRRARDLSSSAIVRMLFDGLVRLNPQEEIELALAERVEVSSDLKSYTFHLRKSEWSNGDPLTAEDFVYAWRKTLSPDFPSDTAFQLYVIENAKSAKEGKVPLEAVGVRAMDLYTLEVRLENPTPYFLELTTSPVFFPVNRNGDMRDSAWAQNAATYVGNGPFVLKEWKHQNQLIVEKNQKYWDAGSVKLERINLCMVKGETELNMFEKRELDWAGSPLSTLPVDAIHALRGGLLKTKEMLGTYLIRTNTERSPLNHPSVRRAFAIAINRKAIVDHITQGNQIPATGLVPLSLGLQKDPYFTDGCERQAAQLFEEGLAAIGLTREDFKEVSLIYRSAERNHLIAQAVQEQWFKAFGVRIKLEPLEAKVYFDRVSKQDYYMATGDWIADFADPINFLEVFKFKKGGSNNTLWENARYLGLLEHSSQEPNAMQRRQLLVESEKILMEEMPIIPIFYYTMLYVNQPQLKDVVLSPMGVIDFKWASKEM